MGIKAASTVTPYVAGTSNFTPTDAPSVPEGYNRYITDIATANTTSPQSIFYQLVVEDGMSVDIDSSITAISENGKLTGFIITPVAIGTDIYFFYPNSGNYISITYSFFIDSPPIGGGNVVTLKPITDNKITLQSVVVVVSVSITT